MQSRLPLLVIVLVLGTARVGYSDDTKTESGSGKLAADRPAAASDEGRQAMQGFRKPKGWSVSLFAAEPELANPVAMCVDNRGRVFVCESFRQDRGVTDNRGHNQEWLLADLAAQSVQDRIDYHLRLLGSEAAEYTAHDDRIRMLEDTDHDSVADRATMFAEGFNQLEDGTGAGVLVRGNTAYFTCIPKLWKLTDVNGDGVAEQRDVLQDGYGVRVAFRGHDSHGLVIGPDGRLYFSIGDRGYNITNDHGSLKNVESGAVFRCELDGSSLEVFASGLRNPQELAFDDYGYLFTGDNNSDSGDKARWVNVMQGGDTGWRMMYQYLPDRGPFNREKIWQPFSQETPAYIVPPIENIADGPSGLTCYPGTGLVGDFANCFFLVDFRGGASNSGIRLIRTQPKGAFWEVERSEQPIWNILATDAEFGPDGALWVCDWVNGWVGEGKGRIYRFFDTSAQEQQIVRDVQQLLANGFAESSTSQLGEGLRHLDRRIRLESQWELATRGQLGELTAVLKDRGAGTIPRLHGVWGIGHAARLNSELRVVAVEAMREALLDEDLDVRTAAARVAGDLRLDSLQELIVSLISDPEPRVQYAACLAAGNLGIDDAILPVCNMLSTNADMDPGLRHAGIMAFKGVAARERLYALASHESRSVRLAAVVALRKLNDTSVADFLSDSEPNVQLEAARAIHDVIELHSALPQLAAMSISADAPDALSHRVLNANFRLGGTESAKRIAAFAADHQRSEAMRIEAINMLGTWSTPGALDRVMNRFLPIAERSSGDSKRYFEENFGQILLGSNGVISSAMKSAVRLGLSGAADVLHEFAASRSNAAELRAQAIDGLVKLEKSGAADFLEGLIEDEDVIVRSKALSKLAEFFPERALEGLRKALGSKTSFEVQSAWDALADVQLPAAKELIEEGVHNYLAGALPPDSWLNLLEAADGRISDELAKSLKSFQESVAQLDPLEAYRECVFGGDVKAGRDLFFNKTELSCVRCHKAGDTGGEVGPNLSEIGKSKDNRYLLESMVHPDAKIAEKFETVVLLTEDDQIISGILREESPSKIELINAEGDIVVIDPIDVVSRKKGKSAMPADLLKNLSRRELRSLVAYLSSLKGS